MTFSVTGGVAPYNWNISGLPPGLTKANGDTTISGTPTTIGSFPITVSVTDDSKPTKLVGTINPTLTVVAPPPLAVSPTSPPPATVSVLYNVTFTPSGGRRSLQRDDYRKRAWADIDEWPTGYDFWNTYNDRELPDHRAGHRQLIPAERPSH